MATSPAKTPAGRRLHGRGSLALPRLTLVLAAVMVLLHALAGPAPEALVLDREAVMRGELWRLVTGHLVHSDGEHLAWNVAGLLVLGFLFEPLLRNRMPGVLLAGIGAVDLGVWYALPELERYCGLSGVLNALLSAGLWRMWRQTRALPVIVAGAGSVAKIVIETVNAGALFTHSAWPSVPLVHAFGFAAGLLWWLFRESAPGMREDRVLQR